MTVGEAFAQAAAEDGIVLEPRTFDWLSEQGHVGLERVAKARRDPEIVEPVKAALRILAAIYERLGGDPSVLPFDVSEQMALCRRWAPRTDGLERGLAAKGFGFGGDGAAAYRRHRDRLSGSGSARP